MRRLTLVLFVLLLLYGVFPGAAQEENTIPPALELVLLQQGEDATLVSRGDGTYALTLNGINDRIIWRFQMPEQDAGVEPASLIVRGWQAAPEPLVVLGVLVGVEYTIGLEISDPVYDGDAQTITYVVRVLSVDPEIKPGQADPPQSMIAPTLFIDLDAAGLRSLVVGSMAAAEGTRDMADANCIMGRCWAVDLASVMSGQHMRKPNGPNPLDIAMLWGRKFQADAAPTFQ